MLRKYDEKKAEKDGSKYFLEIHADHSLIFKRKLTEDINYLNMFWKKKCAGNISINTNELFLDDW